MPRITAEKRQARCQQILDAASRCFSRQGFHRTSMEDIVRESRLSPGAIYCYFRGKNDIVTAIAEERHRYESAVLAGAMRSETVADLLQQLVRAFGEMLQAPQERERRKITIQIW